MSQVVRGFLDGVGTSGHLSVLDGWRGLSILSVLAGHLLPLGPKNLLLNEAFARLGMVFFFILSGFLITRFLIKKPQVYPFVIRRFFRIVPLAWLYIIIALLFTSGELDTVSFDTYLAQLFFYANYPPFYLTDTTAHLWSLCMEMQFYVGVALLVILFKKQGLYLLPIFCVGITLFRFYSEVHISITTYFRVDEILAGCCLALVYEGRNKEYFLGLFRHFNRTLFFLLLLMLFLSCHSIGGWVAYFRPYLAALLIGATLFNSSVASSLQLNNKILLYCAAISYSLYVLHPLLAHSWLGIGDDPIEKYSKRVLLFSALFVLSHLSTFYYEKYWITLAKRLTC